MSLPHESMYVFPLLSVTCDPFWHTGVTQGAADNEVEAVEIGLLDNVVVAGETRNPATYCAALAPVAGVVVWRPFFRKHAPPFPSLPGAQVHASQFGVREQ